MRYTDADLDVLVALSRAVSPPIDPAQVALILWEESGFNPANPGPTAATSPNAVGGLNQMSNRNLAALGIPRAAWLAMTAAQQLPVIYRWWQSVAKTFNAGLFPADAATLLALNLAPGAYEQAGARTDPDAVIAGQSGPFAWIYADNPPLHNATGTITRNTLGAYLQRQATGPGWTALASAVHAAGERAGSVENPPSSPPDSAPTPVPPVRGGGGQIVALLLLAGGVAWSLWRS